MSDLPPGFRLEEELPPGFEPDLPPGFEPEGGPSPLTEAQKKQLAALQTLRGSNPQESASTLARRLQAGEHGGAPLNAKAKATDADLESIVRGEKLPIDAVESAARGFANGATLGFGDELMGLGGGVYDALAGKGPFLDAYRQHRDMARAGLDEAQRAHPGTYLAGDLAGGLATSFVPGVGIARGGSVAGNIGRTALAGGLTSLGASNDDLTTGDADAWKRAGIKTGLGATVGAAASGLGEALGAGANKLAQKASAKIAGAEARAGELAQKAVTEAEQAARSKAGQDAQQLYRALEHIDALRSEGTPEALAQLQELESRGVIKRVREELFFRTVDDLEGKLNQSLASRNAYGQLLEQRPQLLQQATEEIARPSIGKDAASFAKSYGEPILGHAVMGPAGSLIFARTRAGKAIANRLSKPGNQIALYQTLRALAGGSGEAGRVGLEGAAGRSAGVEGAESLIEEIPWLKAALNSQPSQTKAFASALQQQGGAP